MFANWKLKRLAATFAVVLGCEIASAKTSHAADYVWIEAENTAAINIKPNVSGWGRSEFLSDGKWLQYSVDADKVEAELPAAGALLAYDFKTAKTGKQQIWNRIGYEFVRSPFEWRVDGSDWTTVSPQELTTDLMELQTWNEVAWLKLGERQLNAGAHKLEIRLPKTVQSEGNDKGKPARVLYASDAIIITPDAFHPNSKYKPDENFRDAKDEEATKNVFRLPTPAAPGAPGARSSVALNGLWEVARHDEQAPGEVASPIADFPAQPHWKAIPVPSNKNESRPDLVFAHRLWYRTRVEVPANQIGRSFFITFPMNNLNTTVFLNGTFCGFNKNPFARFSLDVTKGVRAGVNEVWVGIRDAWYGYSANPNKPLKLRQKFNIPLSVTGQGFQDLAYPIWNNFQSGIMEAPIWTVAGPTYAADVFVKPSVTRKELAAEVTLTNPSNAAVTGEIAWQAVNDATGAVEKTFSPRPFTLAANAEQTLQLSEGWTNPQLWWPDTPNLYRLRATVNVNGQAVDVSETPFGFREWGARGANFTLNGVNWRMWADLSPLGASSKQEFLDIYRRTNQRTFRLMMPGQGAGQWRYLGMPIDDALEFFDRNGIVVRRNGPLDGEVIGYSLTENDPDLKALNGGSNLKLDLMRNFRDQMVSQVRGERNHPSIHIWTIENEYLFINIINLLGGSPEMDGYEAEIKKTSDAVMAVDPTRLVMTDGGGANKDNSMPVHGNHYVYTGDTRYPDLAYQPFPEGGGRGRWLWDMKRPRFIGEDFFATGINPADYAIWGGEAAFQGKAQARPAADVVFRMLTEGYRWAGQSAWHFWLGQETVVNPWVANSPVAVFVRQWDWTFGSGQKVPRTWGIFNDTQYPDPITFAWTLNLNGKKAAGNTTIHTVAPGTDKKYDETITMPTVSARQSGKLVLSLMVRGKEVFRDVKEISVLPSPKLGGAKPVNTKPRSEKTGKDGAKQTTRLTIQTRSSARISPSSGAALNAKALLVYDPKGAVRAFLKSGGVAFTNLNSLESLPATGKLLIIGKDALDVAESTSSRLAAYAAGGRSIVVLEQKNPLKYQALPAEIEAAPPPQRTDFGQEIPTGEGRVAFIEDREHPVARGLEQKDFFTWGPDGLVYRNAYVKPSRGARSLIQAGPRLQNTALVEVPTGKGLMLLSQLVIGEKLVSNVVAQQVLINLIDYAAKYKQEFRPVAAATDDAQLLKVMDAAGLQYSKAAGPLEAISRPGIKLAVVSATPANLKQLAGNMAKVKAFAQRGGYIVLHGLTPDGLNDYNKVVGFEHMIRPFRRERIGFPATRNPLTSGLTLGDIVMLSGERIFPWTSDEYVASDIFSYVVDYDDVAPFGKSDNYLYENAVNNFFQADAWKLINNFQPPKTGPAEIPFTLPRPQTITEFTWVGNTLYNPQTKVGLVFDGKDKVAFDTRPNAEPQTFAVNPPRTGRQITLQILEWQDLPGKNNTIGIDNFYLKAQRSPEFYARVRPLLNIGAMMEYRMGAGGIVLCNLLFKETETVPVNAAKKRTIFGALLRNLKAPFAGGGNVIAGANLKYTPIDLSKQANQYRNERGWFGDANFTFGALPTGKQNFAGVTYNIYEFPTSPVPTAVMLGGPNVPNNLAEEVRGIPVNLKADALFFLHAARLDQRRNDQERRENKKYEMARYIVTYADGQTATVPIYAEIDVDDYRQKTPTAILGAQLAWTKPYAGTEFSAVAYSKQWNNPRPDVAIKSLDLVYGPDRRGVPALLAVTAATAAR